MATISASRKAPPRMTEEEFEAWCDEDVKAEFVDGEVIILPPVAIEHSDVGHFLGRLVGEFLDERPGGKLFGPEFQVRLRAGLRRVRDLAYVRPENMHRIERTRLEGAPDAIFEYVSKESVDRDWHQKYAEYQASGVREYWLIEPDRKLVHLFRLDPAGVYRQIPEADGRLYSDVLPGFWLRSSWLWQDPPPRVRDCLRDMGVLDGTSG